MDEQNPPHGNEPPPADAQPGDTPQHDEPEQSHGRQHGQGHGHEPEPVHEPGPVPEPVPEPHVHQPGEVCCRDTILTINGQSFDLAREPLKIEYCGFTLDISYSAAKERTPGETHVEQHDGHEIAVVGPDKGDPAKGIPPGRLFINGKHIEYVYHPATGEVGHLEMFSLHRSLLELARTYITSNPGLAEFPGHHH